MGFIKLVRVATIFREIRENIFSYISEKTVATLTNVQMILNSRSNAIGWDDLCTGKYHLFLIPSEVRLGIGVQSNRLSLSAVENNSNNTKTQLDIPKKLNKRLKVDRIEMELKDMSELIIIILKEHYKLK